MKNPSKLFLSILFALFLGNEKPAFAQSGVRYKTEIFTKIDTIKNVQYGESMNIKSESEKLLLDIYLPQSDTEKKRPLLVCVHGGGFVNGDKEKGFQISFCKGFAKKGYVTSSINYRLGVEKPRTDLNYFEAMYRAVQDAKTAVRFFRKNAEKYGIDTTKIIIAGGSAGGMTVLQLAYLDQDEVPKTFDTSKFGTLEGKSGNEGYSSNVQAVINCWGSMIDYNWIKKVMLPCLMFTEQPILRFPTMVHSAITDSNMVAKTYMNILPHWEIFQV